MSTTSARVIELNLYPQYFDLVAVGRKAWEVRVKYPKFDGMAVGDLIRVRREGHRPVVHCAGDTHRRMRLVRGTLGRRRAFPCESRGFE